MVKGNNRIEKGRRRGGWKEFGSGTRRRPVQRDYGSSDQTLDLLKEAQAAAGLWRSRQAEVGKA